MVNRIDGNNYYDYQKLKNVNIPEAGEKFSLDYKQNELQSESKDKKDEAEKTTGEQNSESDKSGVRLELSRQGQSAASGRTRSDNAPKSRETVDIQSIINTIREYISTAIAAVKEFFYNVWNDPQPETDIQASEESTDFDETSDISDKQEASTNAGNVNSAETDVDAGTAYRINNEKLDREIQPYLRKGNLDQVINLLTDNGRRTIAMNSSLLTYYDKNGRMVEPNASDRERILHGDGNTRKL